jgi:outer membrane protein OmpA-like peptidoglycan-associated protein
MRKTLLCSFINLLLISQLHTQTFENLGVTVNSMYQEGYPLISPDGQTLYFTRLGHPQNVGEADLEDVWMAIRQTGDVWSAPINLSAPINNREPNIIAGINIDGNKLFLKGGYERNVASILYLSRKSQSRVWTTPRPLQLGEWRSKTFSENYTVNSHGNIAICAIESPPALGKPINNDLYISFKNEQNDTWSTPQSLGIQINSADSEIFGFLAPDDKTLYFNRKHNNENRIYASHRLNETWKDWSEPVVIETGGVKLTDASACSVAAAGDYLYFNAIQQEESTMDLYRVRLQEEARPESMVLVTGSISEEEQPIPNNLVRLQYLDDGKTKLYSIDNERDFKLIIPRINDILFCLENQNGYAETVVIDASNTLTVEPDNDATAWTGAIDPEIERLELKIAELDRSMQRTEVRRSTEQNRVATAQPPIPSQQKKRETVVQTPPSNPTQSNAVIPNSNPSNSKDKEMDDLKNKYNKILQNYKQNSSKSQAPADDQDNPPVQNSQQDPEVARLEARLKGQTQPSRPAENAYQTPHVDTLSHELIRLYMTRMNHLWSLDLQLQQLEEVRQTLEAELLESERYYLNGTVRDKQRQLRNALNMERDKISNQNLSYYLNFDLEEQVHFNWRITVREPQRIALKYDIHYLIQKSVRDKYQSELATRRREQENANINGALRSKSVTPSAFNKFGNQGFLAQKIVLRTYPAQENVIFPLNGIFFPTNSTTLRPESAWELELLVHFLEKNPSLGVEVRAHTNGHCSLITAQTLTDGRAIAVGNFLKAKGIAAMRVETRGIGKNEPLMSNESPEGRRKNQRIEIRLIKI